MLYGKYRGVRDAAWQCLIDYNVKELPVQIIDIAKKANVKVSRNSKAHWLKPKESGASFYRYDKEQWYIVYNDKEPIPRCKFTVAHELGHIYLGHTTKDGKHARTFDITKTEEETEADMFAARLLAPACVLWALDLHTPKEISRICDISQQAAEVRAERMKVLYERDKFLLSPLERQVYKNFEKFINKQKNIPAEPPLNEDLDKHLLDKN